MSLASPAMHDPFALLEGVVVLDLGLWRPAPFAAQLLAELGADVTKVEPVGGDPMRAFAGLYDTLNERKQVVELDLKDDADRERALTLAAEADVVVEGFRPGVADRLGVGYEAVRSRNPSVLYCSISGYGQTGPLRDLPGHDVNYQAWSGVLAARLPEVNRTGIPIADLAGGAYAALGICAALAARARTGDGRYIDVSMADVLLSWALPQAGGELTSGADPAHNFPAYGTFECRDGWITLGVVTEEPFWQALCGALGLEELAALRAPDRAADGPALRVRLALAIEARSRDDLVAELVAAGVPVAPILSPAEAADAAVFVSRGIVERAVDGSACPAHPVRFVDPSG